VVAQKRKRGKRSKQQKSGAKKRSKSTSIVAAEGAAEADAHHDEALSAADLIACDPMSAMGIEDHDRLTPACSNKHADGGSEVDTELLAVLNGQLREEGLGELAAESCSVANVDECESADEEIERDDKGSSVTPYSWEKSGASIVDNLTAGHNIVMYLKGKTPQLALVVSRTDEFTTDGGDAKKRTDLEVHHKRVNTLMLVSANTDGTILRKAVGATEQQKQFDSIMAGCCGGAVEGRRGASQWCVPLSVQAAMIANCML
jgi:hypothetical protein